MVTDRERSVLTGRRFGSDEGTIPQRRRGIYLPGTRHTWRRRGTSR